MQLNTNGIHRITHDSVGTHTVLISGSLGGGTAELGYLTDGFVALTGGSLALGQQYKVEAGAGVDLYINLAGSSAANLDVITGRL